jgi:hypothetical protein
MMERMPFDELVKHADTVRAGDDAGVRCMVEIKGDVEKLDMQQRIVFFASMLRVPINCMKASIGVEATMALLDAVKEHLTNG